MSSSLRRHDSHDPRFERGLVYQAGKIVGLVDLPADVQRFVDQFNHEYAAAGLWVAPARAATAPRNGDC